MWTVNFFLRAEGHSTPVMFIKDQSDFLIRTRIWGLFSPQNTQELPVTRLKVFVHSRSNCHFESGFWSVGWGWENRSTVKKPLRQLYRTKNESQTQTLPTYDFDAGTWTSNHSGGSWVLLPLRHPCFPTPPPLPHRSRNMGTRSNKGGATTSLIEAFFTPHTLLTFVMPQTV